MRSSGPWKYCIVNFDSKLTWFEPNWASQAVPFINIRKNIEKLFSKFINIEAFQHS